MKKYTYEVWALGYDAEDAATDREIFLGKFGNAKDAIAHAEKFYDLECFTGIPGGPDYDDLDLEAGEYFIVQVQVVQECENPEDGSECIDIVWECDVR